MWQNLQNQVIVAGMGEVLGINHLAIHAMLDLYGYGREELRIERQLLFEKILAVDAVTREITDDKRKIKEAEEAAKAARSMHSKPLK